MKLKKIDQTRFDMIKSMAENFLAMGQDLEFVMTGLKSQIEEFEQEVGVKIKIDPEADDKVTLIDLRKDFMRTRHPNSESLVFRAKTHGVPVEVKVFKAGEYEFNNADIIGSLKALVEKIEGLDGQIKDMGHSDFKEEGSQADSDEDFDGNEEYYSEGESDHDEEHEEHEEHDEHDEHDEE